MKVQPWNWGGMGVGGWGGGEASSSFIASQQVSL